VCGALVRKTTGSSRRQGMDRLHPQSSGQKSTWRDFCSASIYRDVGPCPVRVIRAVLTVDRSLPVYPEQRTSSDRPGMSQTCHRQAHSCRLPVDLFAFSSACRRITIAVRRTVQSGSLFELQTRRLVVRSPQRGFISAGSSDRRQGCLVEE
jgi:hypothetical protein